MFDHLDFAVVDLAGSLTGEQFWIGKGEAVKGRMHIAFAVQSRADVDAFHRAALDAGGVCKGAPGIRPVYGEHYYAAFVFDPDGHTIEAVCRKPE